jgi:glycerophosphoryl diester phosphodiesterase
MGSSPLIVAHRGFTAQHRENTLEAFNEAIGIGADMIELDVRVTSDNVIVVLHDDCIDGIPLSETTYKDLNERTAHRGFKIPRIEEVIELTKGRINLDIELKEEGYEAQVVNILLKVLNPDDYIITTFHDFSLHKIKSQFPEIKVGLLLGLDKPKRIIITRYRELFPLHRCKITKTDLIAPHWKLLKFGFLNRAKKHNYPVHIWTVNEDRLLEKYINDDRIRAIITDKPDRAIAIRKKLSQSASV